ncbi:MAG: glycosyltransferase family 4 protein [Candidatus Hadarchaeales archaeon]
MEEPNVFIWKGGKEGGSERVAMAIAEGFRKHWKLIPTLGVFERSKTNFPQIEVKRIFPEKLMGYNCVWGTYYLNKIGALKPFDIVFSHGGYFLKTKNNFYACYESGDIERMLKLLPKISSLVSTPVTKLNLSMMRKADLVVVPSEELIDSFLKRHGIWKYRICSGSRVDIRIFKPIKIPKTNNKFSLLFVGRSSDARKNFDTLAKVCLKLSKKVELYIIDSSKKKEKVGNLFFLGGVSTKELAWWYNKCDLLVLPSFWEGLFPAVVLEALACEKPCLVSKYAVGRTLMEWLTIFDPFSKEDLERKILWVMKNYDEVKEKAKEGSRYIRKNFEINKVTKKMTTLILEEWGEKK